MTAEDGIQKSGPRRGSSFARFILRMFGWKVVGTAPDLNRYVLIGAHHTTNWDFLLALLVAASLGVRIHWLAKHTLFRPPMGMLMRALGGIAVERETRTGAVEELAAGIREADRFVLGIAPEGTRSRTDHWKSGFYRVATAAGVPIVLGFVDASRKEAGLGPVFFPTGEIRVDFDTIAAFYADKRGIYPDKESACRLREGG